MAPIAEFPETAAATPERARPLIDWPDDFERSLVYHVVAGTVLNDFPDLIDAQLFGGEDPATHTTGPINVIVQEAINYHKKHKAAPGTHITDIIRAMKRNKDLIPRIEEVWEEIVEHESSNPTLYDEMKVHLGARCLYRASRQKVLAESEWLARGEFETIEEYAEKQKDLLERVERIEKAGNLKQPFKLTKADTFDAPPVTWVIDKLLPAGMLSMVAGKDGLGKSLLTMEMGKCVLPSGPEKFLGKFDVVTRGPVLILAMDDPDSLINDRLKEMGIKNHPDLYVPQDIDYSDPVTLLRHVQAVSEEVRPALIIVDCLYRLLPKQANSNNDASSMAPLLNILNTVAEKTGAAVILVHHEKKNGDEIAGSFAIRASLKTLIRISKPKPPKASRNNPFPEPPDESARIMGLDKSKLVGEASWTLRLEGVGKWTISDEVEDKTSLLEHAIMATLRDHPDGLNRTDMGRQMGLIGKRYKDLVSLLDQLVYERKIVRRVVKRPDIHGNMKMGEAFSIPSLTPDLKPEDVIPADRDRVARAKQSLAGFYQGKK